MFRARRVANIVLACALARCPHFCRTKWPSKGFMAAGHGMWPHFGVHVVLGFFARCFIHIIQTLFSSCAWPGWPQEQPAHLELLATLHGALGGIPANGITSLRLDTCRACCFQPALVAKAIFQAVSTISPQRYVPGSQGLPQNPLKRVCSPSDRALFGDPIWGTLRTGVWHGPTAA